MRLVRRELARYRRPRREQRPCLRVVLGSCQDDAP